MKIADRAKPIDCLHAMLRTVFTTTMFAIDIIIGIEQYSDYILNIVISYLLDKGQSLAKLGKDLQKICLGDEDIERQHLSLDGNGCKVVLRFWKKLLVDPIIIIILQ